MKYLFVKSYYFSHLLSEVPDDENAREYIQLEPLCTTPNLQNYLRRLKPKSVEASDLCDISKWNDIFLLDPTTPKHEEEIAEKFNVTRDWKGYVDRLKEDTEKAVCTKYFNLLYLCRTL